MSFRSIFRLLSVLLLLPCTTNLHAQEDGTQWVHSLTVKMGRTFPTDSLRVWMEYPQYAPMLPADTLFLHKAGFMPQKDVLFHINYGLSRGETIADISYIPVIKRGGKWLRITDFDIKHALTGAKLSMAVRRMMRAAQAAEQNARYASTSVLSSGKWVKIGVQKEGIYQISDAFLRKAGFSDPSKVRLFGYGGRLLPEKFSFTGDDALIDDLCEVPLFRRDGSSLFFAEGLLRWNSNGRPALNTFSSYSCYFLTEGDSPATLSTLDAPQAESTAINTIEARALAGGDGTYIWYGGGRDFYDTNDLRSSGHTFRLSLPGCQDTTVSVRYDISAQSATTTSTATIYQTGLASGQKRVAQATISKIGEGETARGYRGAFTATVSGDEARFLVSCTNTSHLGHLACQYKQRLSTDCTTSSFTAGTEGATDLYIAAATATTRVLQLQTPAAQAALLPGTLQGTTYIARATDGTQRFILLDTETAYPEPTLIGDVSNQNLHGDGAADMVIIIPASGKLAEQAERLAETHRVKDGLKVNVVRADLLYNEFSSGTPDATAYRRYLKMLYDRAAANGEAAPRYLLLFGDCAYDNRMITQEWKNSSPDDYLLAYERNDQEDYQNSGYSIGTLHSYVTDDYFALLDDGEGGNLKTDKPDLGVGRFVCHTAEKAKWLTDRAIEYMGNASTGAWKNRIWAIADVGDNNLHMNDAEAVIKQVGKSANEAMLLRRIYPDAYDITQEAKGATYPEATAKLKRAMQQGALIFNYNGHGSADRLSHNFLLYKEEMAANSSTARPLWLFASCEITPYDQDVEDLGRNALFATDGPAIAVVCAARSVYSNYNRTLNIGLMKYLFSRDSNGLRYKMGDAMRLTKAELMSGLSGGSTIGTDQTINKLKYVLLGDPALTLRYPEPGITIDSINGQAVAADADGSGLTNQSIGGVVRFSGYVNADTLAHTPDTSFNGTLTATMFTPKQTITCKAYGSRTALSYSDYTRTFFEGSVKVTGGRFTVETMVPRGISSSTDPALLSLYAVNDDASAELHGCFSRFCLNGTAGQEETDTLGPDIYVYLNTPDFPDGGTVSTEATFYASVSDSTALSMVSGNLGHDMELWMDSDPSTTATLNDYFTFDYDSYRKGLVEYPLSSLTPGRHTLSFRAWDAMDNSSTATLSFTVVEGEVSTFDVTAVRASASSTAVRFITTFTANAAAAENVTTEVYSIEGRRLWHRSAQIPAGTGYATFDWNATDYAGTPLTKGVYLYRSQVGGRKTGTKKIIML